MTFVKYLPTIKFLNQDLLYHHTVHNMNIFDSKGKFITKTLKPTINVI